MVAHGVANAVAGRGGRCCKCRLEAGVKSPRGLMEILKCLSLHFGQNLWCYPGDGGADEAGNGVKSCHQLVSTGFAVSERVLSLPSGQDVPD